MLQFLLLLDTHRLWILLGKQCYLFEIRSVCLIDILRISFLMVKLKLLHEVLILIERLLLHFKLLIINFAQFLSS